MTDSGNANDEEKNEEKSHSPDETSSEQAGSGAAADNSAAPVHGSSAGSTPADHTASGSAEVSASAEGLPEEEELTPEIVEEEAIRGDFMLRWAAVFLAVLFGFSQMADTQTLIHIRSGDQLRANGFLPTGADTFSYTLDDKSAPNVSWLFDHVVSAVYAAGGENALTIFKALLAGFIAYVLSLISVRNMPTWWNSICVVLAVAACSVDFIPVTDLATLLGLSLTLLFLHRYSEGSASGLFWKLPLLVAVWANCDPRAYLGVVAILLFAIGSNFRKSMAGKAGDPPGEDVSTLWKAAGFSAVALLVNPSPLASFLSVLTTYSVEYPTMAAMRTLSDPTALLDGRTEYYSIFVPQVLQGIEFAYVAGFSLLVIGLVVLVIGRSREDLPWAMVWLGFTVLALFKLHELPAAALVATAAAGTAAQRWYARTFRQDYTVETMEVLFSRGGRALTVLAMAFLGFCAVADRLPVRTAIGMGFDPELRETIDSLGIQLAEIPEDARIFNTRISQGDLLIWHGRQNFTDSRTALFGKLDDDESVIARFESLRRSLLPRPSPVEAAALETTGEESVESSDAASGENDLYNAEWRTEFTNYGIDQVMLRLSPPGRPAYSMMRAFLQEPNWVMTSRGASAAFFRYSNEPTGGAEYSIRDTVFRSEVADDEKKETERYDYAQEPSFYQKYLYESRPTASAALREARHLLELDFMPPQIVFNIARATGGNPENVELMTLLGRALGAPILAIRRANEALREDPQNAAAYQVLGSAYLHLNACEQAISEAMSGASASETRYLQAVMAFRQAAIIEPEASGNWRILSGLYEERGRSDLALECLTEFLKLEEDTLLNNPDADAELRQIYEKRNAWEKIRNEVLTQLETHLEQSMPEDPQQQALMKLEIIRNLQQRGHVRIALDQMKKNQSLMQSVPQAEVLRGELLLEAGELEDAFQVLNRLAEVARDRPESPEFAGVKWHTPAARTHLGKAGYAEAVAAYKSNLMIFDRFETKSPDLMRSLIQMLPLVPAIDAQRSRGAWPMTLLETLQVPLSAIPSSRNEPTFLTALAHLEDGNLSAAADAFRALVKEGGETAFRPLAAVYLLQLDDEAATVLANSFLQPWEDFTFPGDEAAAEQSATGANGNETEAADADAGAKDGASPEESDKGGSEATSPAPQDAVDDAAKPDDATKTEDVSK